jgi:CRP/FNR family transcriptional regulator, transcriptional activator FtrB
MTAKTRVDIALLRSLPLLGSASEEHTQKLAAVASLRTAPSRTILFAEGSRVEQLFVLTRGACELFSEQDERRFTVAVVRGAQALEVSSILAERHPLSARVLEPSEFVSVPVKLIIELSGRDTGLADALVHELAKESLQIIDDFKKHRLLNTTARIAHWMLQSDRQSGGSGRIVIPFDKRVLASYLGMTPEQLSRGFATLVSAGVTVDGRMVSIADRGKLTRIARREE